MSSEFTKNRILKSEKLSNLTIEDGYNLANEIQKAFRGIGQAVKQGEARALNRALSATKTKLAKDLKAETGMASADIKKRMAFFGATKDKLAVTLTLLIQRAIPITKFGAQIKKIIVDQKNGRRVAHYGVTAKIGDAGRQVVAGAFFLVGKTGTAVISRVGPDKYPTQVVTTSILNDAAQAHKDEAQKYMVDTFNGIVQHEIEFAVQKKFDSDKKT